MASTADSTRALLAETAHFINESSNTTYSTTYVNSSSHAYSSNIRPLGAAATHNDGTASITSATTDYNLNSLWQEQKDKMLKYSTLGADYTAKEGRLSEKKFIQSTGRRARPSLKIDWGKANAKLPIGQTEDMLTFRNSLYETFDKQSRGHLTMADTIRGARDVLMLEEAVVQGDEEIL